jgi:hypothetical protein
LFQGWHAVHEGFPIPMINDEITPLLQLTAPFFARILSILKHSNINVHCLNSPRGDAFIKILEEVIILKCTIANDCKSQFFFGGGRVSARNEFGNNPPDEF